MAVLYHGSPLPGIEEFRPSAMSVRDSTEGDVVFASPVRALACAFMIRWGDDWCSLGRYGTDDFWHLIVSDKDRFEAADLGGTVYTLPAASFTTDPAAGMGEAEWVSRKPVRPLHAEKCRSAVRAMIDAGLHLIYVSRAEFERTSDMAVSKMPAAGRAPRTAGNTRPPVKAGKLTGNSALANAATVAPEANKSGGTAPTPQGGAGS